MVITSDELKRINARLQAAYQGRLYLRRAADGRLRIESVRPGGTAVLGESVNRIGSAALGRPFRHERTEVLDASGAARSPSPV